MVIPFFIFLRHVIVDPDSAPKKIMVRPARRNLAMCRLKSAASRPRAPHTTSEDPAASEQSAISRAMSSLQEEIVVVEMHRIHAVFAGEKAEMFRRARGFLHLSRLRP